MGRTLHDLSGEVMGILVGLGLKRQLEKVIAAPFHLDDRLRFHDTKNNAAMAAMNRRFHGHIDGDSRKARLLIRKRAVKLNRIRRKPPMSTNDRTLPRTLTIDLVYRSGGLQATYSQDDSEPSTARVT